MDNRLAWYPGHIKAARQEIYKRLKKIDFLIEVLDARAPISSVSGVFSEFKDKGHLLLINKSDLVTEDYKKKIKERFKGMNYRMISAVKQKNFKVVLEEIQKMANSKLNKISKYGFKATSVFVMVAGMPNVGKTNFIQKISGKKKLRIANRPGVTRAEQWITHGNLKILDTPGVLYPDINSIETLYKLGVINCIDPVKTGIIEVLEYFWNSLEQEEKKMITDFYKIEVSDTFEDFVEKFQEKRSITNIDNIAMIIFSDYNKGSFKNIVMDRL